MKGMANQREADEGSQDRQGQRRNHKQRIKCQDRGTNHTTTKCITKRWPFNNIGDLIITREGRFNVLICKRVNKTTG
ncbi:hypothetical protein KR100_12425 [Synechococcus sp. KORDI-100]|nr:hypothetical protein KR100_12425 [Synechococcus sp. KORDI-100]